jgi:hypothetical protein
MFTVLCMGCLRSHNSKTFAGLDETDISLKSALKTKPEKPLTCLLKPQNKKFMFSKITFFVLSQACLGADIFWIRAGPSPF